MTIKNLIFLCAASTALLIICWVFWKHEVKYSAPTPIPNNFVDVPVGARLSLDEWNVPLTKSTLLHFFNPECPCSKFNMNEFRALVKQFSHEVNFVIVLQSTDTNAANEFEDKYELSLPIIVDIDGRISDLCGIYATPQAVILDRKSEIYFKGNYNKSRFCTHQQTRFVEIALNNLVANRPLPLFVTTELTIPYGCELPSDIPQDEYSFSNFFNL